MTSKAEEITTATKQEIGAKEKRGAPALGAVDAPNLDSQGMWAGFDFEAEAALGSMDRRSIPMSPHGRNSRLGHSDLTIPTVSEASIDIDACEFTLTAPELGMDIDMAGQANRALSPANFDLEYSDPMERVQCPTIFYLKPFSEEIQSPSAFSKILVIPSLFSGDQDP